ncbi:reverse transcriptase domain-containing protein [Tanacetum coccineum]
MPPRRASVARRAPDARRAPSARTANNPARNASTTTDAPMSVAAINQLIETRVAEALANQEQLRNSGVNGDVGHDVAYDMPWKTLMKMMTVKYCPRSVIKKLEIEIWNLKVKGNVMLARPKTMQETIKLANDLMDQKVHAYAERQDENKRKFDNNNQAQQQLPKRQNVVQAYTIGSGEKKEYVGTLPLCNKCNFHHHGPCTIKCANCKKVSHLTRDCWNLTTANNQRTITCYEYGNQGHYRSDCPKIRNRNHGNQAKDTEAHGLVYALGGEETDQDPNNIEDEIEAQKEDFLASTSER